MQVKIKLYILKFIILPRRKGGWRSGNQKTKKRLPYHESGVRVRGDSSASPWAHRCALSPTRARRPRRKRASARVLARRRPRKNRLPRGERFESPNPGQLGALRRPAVTCGVVGLLSRPPQKTPPSVPVRTVLVRLTLSLPSWQCVSLFTNEKHYPRLKFLFWR